MKTGHSRGNTSYDEIKTARILKQVKSTFLTESTFLYIFLYSLFQDVFASHFVNHVIFINTSDPNYSFTNTKTSPYASLFCQAQGNS